MHSSQKISSKNIWFNASLEAIKNKCKNGYKGTVFGSLDNVNIIKTVIYRRSICHFSIILQQPQKELNSQPETV